MIASTGRYPVCPPIQPGHRDTPRVCVPYVPSKGLRAGTCRHYKCPAKNVPAMSATAMLPAGGTSRSAAAVSTVQINVASTAPPAYRIGELRLWLRQATLERRAGPAQA